MRALPALLLSDEEECTPQPPSFDETVYLANAAEIRKPFPSWPCVAAAHIDVKQASLSCGRDSLHGSNGGAIDVGMHMCVL